MTTKTKRPYKVIDLKDYTKESYTFDDRDFYFDSPNIKSLEEAKDSCNIPHYKFPKNFDKEEKLDCINHAYYRADEASYMAQYTENFWAFLIDKLNDMDSKVSFEYETRCWDTIKFKVFYDISFIVGNEEERDLEEYLHNLDFNGAINNTHSKMERFCDHDDKVFKEVYLEAIEERVFEIKKDKSDLYKRIKSTINQKVSEKQKIFNVLKLIKDN